MKGHLFRWPFFMLRLQT